MVTESERIITSEIVKRLNQNDVRLRELEQGLAKLEDAMRTMEERLSEAETDFDSKLEKERSEISGTVSSIDDIKAQLGGIRKDIEDKVGREEFKEVANYVNLMNPALGAFATKDEVKRMIDESKGK